MTVVIDCNVFVVCLTSRSPYHYIYRSLVAGKFTMVVSQDILLEKELPNVVHVSPFYKWLLIDTDPDDNKYCDCAIVGQAVYIVTEDKHFNVLKTISFPKLTAITLDEFLGKL